MIVSVDFGGKLWISPDADLTAGMAFSVNSIEFDPAVTVSSRPNAAGEFRMVRTRGRQQVAKVQLNFCTDVQQQFLANYQGEPLWFRSTLCDTFAGFYADSTFTPRPVGNSWAVPLTVQQISLSDQV